MIVLIGLIVLIAAVIIGVTGVLANGGQDHELVNSFVVFGYHVTGSNGALFLYGIAIGAIGVIGLGLLLAGYRRTARRGSVARRELRQSRRQNRVTPRWQDRLRRPTRPRVASPDPTPETKPTTQGTPARKE